MSFAVTLCLSAACAAIGLENARASILPHMRAGCSPYERIADDIRGHTRNGDIVIVTGIGDLAECEVNIPYFADRGVISLHTEFTRHRENAAETKLAVQQEVSNALRDRHHVFMLDEAHDPAFASRNLVTKHPQASPAILRAMFAPWPKTVAWRSSHGPVWELNRRQAPRTSHTETHPTGKHHGKALQA